MFATFIRNQPNPKPNRDTNNNSQFLYSLRIYVFHCFIVTTTAERKDGITYLHRNNNADKNPLAIL